MGRGMGITILDQIIRISVAIVVGGIIGLERKRLHKAAGVRTHAVVTVICTMLTIVSVYGFNGLPGNIDPTRLLSNIITGIGFLAGGVIFVTTKKDSKNLGENVVGVTTAAGIFGAAMLGIPIGLGHFDLVVITIVGIEISLQAERVLKKVHLINDDKIKNEIEADKNKNIINGDTVKLKITTNLPDEIGLEINLANENGYSGKELVTIKSGTTETDVF